ncbi:MAG: transposase [Methylococcales bacterium]
MPMVSIEAIGIAIYDEKVGDVLKSICLEIEKKYQIQLLKITTDKGHVHCLVQSLTT